MDTDELNNLQAPAKKHDKHLDSIITIGWPDKFIEHGDVKSLEKKYSLDAESIAANIEKRYNELNLDR